MFLGSRKFIGNVSLTNNPFDFLAQGSSASGISMDPTGFFAMSTAFSGSDTRGYIDSTEPESNFSTVTILTPGKILSVVIKSMQVTYINANTPDLSRTCQLKLVYGRYSNYNTGDFQSDVSNTITITSNVDATAVLSGGNYTHTNNFSTFSTEGTNGTSGPTNICPIQFFFKKTITESSNTATSSKIGLIPSYKVSAGGLATSARMTITISDNDA